MPTADLTEKRNSRYSPRVRKTQQQIFLQTLEETGNQLEACQRAGIAIRTVQYWAVKDDAFSQKRDEAQQIGDLVTRMRYEHKLDRDCLSTTQFDKVTAILAMFRMKRLDPRYRDNTQVNVSQTE